MKYGKANIRLLLRFIELKWRKIRKAVFKKSPRRYFAMQELRLV